MASSPDFWQHLRQYTGARIALGRAGNSITTKELLDFQLAHAQARDAVHAQLQVEEVITQLAKHHQPILTLSSQATDRRMYLQRPDLGRRLDQESASSIKARPTAEYDICLVVADGLSALAIEKNISPFLDELLPRLQSQGYHLAPICLVRQGRVAVGDEIGHLLNSRMVIVLIGERPGLSSPDSMGIYLTYQPIKGLTDEKRNCISNVRQAGLSYPFAAEKLLYLINESFRRKLSGVALKDDLTLRLEDGKVLEQE